MKKMNIKSKLVGVVAVASAFFIGATPMTVFAQSNEEAEVVETEVTEDVEVEETVVEESAVEAELPYHYTINEDGSIVFSFNGEEYTYGEEEDPTGTVVTRGSRLNVRTGAGMDYEIIDQLCPGEEVSVIGTEGDWYKIIVPAKTGYVHGDYLEVLESATNETDAALLQMFMMMFMDNMNGEGGALTPDGNMNLIDDYGSTTKAGKQFITLTTKNGNYFYLIIDRDDKGTETVHFLNLVDERDLLFLMEEEEVNEYLGTEEVTEKEQIKPEEPVVEEVEEPVEEAPKKEFNTSILIIFPLASLAIIGAYIYMKKKKNQPKRPAVDPDADYTDDEDDFLSELEEEEEVEEEES